MNIKKISLLSVLALSLGQPAQAGKVQTTLSLATFIYQNWQTVVPLAVGLGMVVKREFSKITGFDQETQTKQENKSEEEKIAGLRKKQDEAQLRLVQVTAIYNHLYTKCKEVKEAILSDQPVVIPTEQELDTRLQSVSETARAGHILKQNKIQITQTGTAAFEIVTNRTNQEESQQQNMFVRFFWFLFSDSSNE